MDRFAAMSDLRSPGSAAYLDAVRSTLPGIRARAATVDRVGRIPDETIRDLDEVGIFRGLQPRQWGGLELDPMTFFESVALLASACGSTGWVGGVVAVHPWEVGLLSNQAQEDVWGADPKVRLSSSYAPTGKAFAVDGGYELSGQWRFSSGVDLSDWAILGAIPEGETEADIRACLVRRADFSVDPDSWKVAGLAGTGSKTINIVRAFVPAYLSHKIADVNRGLVPGWEVNDRPLYHLPFMAGIFSYAIAAPAIGAATGALEAFVEQTRTRIGAYGGPPVATTPAVQLRLSNARLEVDDARMRMQRTWEEFYSLACQGKPIGPDLQARGRYEAARSISRCLHAVIDVFEVAGGGVMNLSNPIQRYLRDLLAMRNHPMGAIESSAATFARSQLTVEGRPATYAPGGQQ
ncbi:MAG: flavin-dependent monooxygenase [Dehalococcoidia bacterium]